MSAVASRKALELCVKWIYSTDETLGRPREDGLQALLHNNGFSSLMDYSLWRRFQYIVKNGNMPVHTAKTLSKEDAILSLNILFDFVQWIEYCYGQEYTERKFNAHIIPNANAESKRIEAEYACVIRDIQKNADKIVDDSGQHTKFQKNPKTELRDVGYSCPGSRIGQQGGRAVTERGLRKPK